MEQDQLTAAVIAGIVIVTSCVSIVLSFFGCGRNHPKSNQYFDVSSEDLNLIQ